MPVEKKVTSEIPLPQYQSWCHKRIPIPIETNEEQQARWKKQPTPVIVFEALLSRLAKKLHVFPKYRYTILRLVNGFFYVYFKLFNRLEIIDKHLLPKNGVLIYITHHSVMDPLIIFCCFPTTFFGSLMSWGNGWFADLNDKFYGMVAFKEEDSRQIKVEKMVRSILQKTPFFAIAPEGLVAHDLTVRQGFSSFVDVYLTVNSRGDKIPFMPVLIRGAEKYFRIKPVFDKTTIQFFPPFFIPREWHRPVNEGGKSPREIADYCMQLLARKNGQQTFAPNPRLDRKWDVHKINQKSM